MSLLTNLVIFRTIQCDKTAPTCLKCEKAGIECEGYTDGLVWVNRTVDNRPKLQVKLRQQQQQPGSAHSQQIILHDDTSSPDSSSPGGGSPESAWVADVARSADILLPAHLARSAREQLYMGYFGSTLLAAGTTMPSEGAMGFASMGWTKHIGPLYETDPAVRCAAMATSSAIIATLHNDKNLQVKGIQAYNSSVMEMVKGLQRTNWYKRDGLLTAARIMATFEVRRLD